MAYCLSDSPSSRLSMPLSELQAQVSPKHVPSEVCVCVFKITDGDVEVRIR